MTSFFPSPAVPSPAVPAPPAPGTGPRNRRRPGSLSLADGNGVHPGQEPGAGPRRYRPMIGIQHVASRGRT